MSDTDSDFDGRMEIDAAADAALQEMVPQKSKVRYEKAYKSFQNWMQEKKIKTVDEKVMLAYFNTEMAKFAPSSKWTFYSMLRTMINLNNNVDIAKFTKLVAILKRRSDGFQPKKSRILDKISILSYLRDADDHEALDIKVAMIIGVFGACRRQELQQMSVKDVIDLGDCLKITVPVTKTKHPREFVITRGNEPDVDYVAIVKKYMCLRLQIINHDRLFVNYRNGKCSIQGIGVNKIGDYPKKIAQFLKLPNPEQYTGHCFRRSSASLLADSGVDVSVLQRHGGWKSAAVAKGYVERSLGNKKQIATNILGRSSTSTSSNADVTMAQLDNNEVPADLGAYQLETTSNTNLVAIASTSNDVEMNANTHQPDVELNANVVQPRMGISNSMSPATFAFNAPTRIATSNTINAQPSCINPFSFSNNHNCTFNFNMK